MARRELAEPPTIDNPAFTHEVHHVAILNSAQPMGHDENRLRRTELENRIDYPSLGFVIEGRSRFIQDQKLRIVVERSGYSYALPFAT